MKKFLSPVCTLLILLSSLFLFSCDNECRHTEINTSIVAPTCDSEGYTLNRCKNCSFEYKSDIKAPAGHTFDTTVYAPTCDSEGYTLYRCKNCSFEYKSDIKAPTGHIFDTTVYAPTCDSEGYTLYRCKNCSFEYKSDIKAPTGHIFDTTVYAPTCTEAGRTEYVCLTCGYSYTADFVPQKSHNFIADRTYATISADGCTSYLCSDCGYSYVGMQTFSDEIFKGAFVENKEILAKGVDVSIYNGTVDYNALKESGIDFVIIKAGSTRGPDSRFEQNYAGAKAAGLDVGCYFYTYSSTVEGALSDADLLLGWLDGKKFEYPVYFDLEDKSLENTDKTILTDMILAFIEKMQSEGYYAALYANNNWLINFLEKDRLVSEVDIWLARWKTSGQPDWDEEKFGTRMGLWQYTGFDAASSDVFDLNVAFYDYPSHIKIWGYNGY